MGVYICIWIRMYVLRTYSYCIWRVISPTSSLNQFSSSLGHFCHVPFKIDQLDWDWRIWWNDTPHAMGCTYAYRVNTNSYICIHTCISHMHVCILVCACQYAICVHKTTHTHARVETHTYIYRRHTHTFIQQVNNHLCLCSHTYILYVHVCRLVFACMYIIYVHTHAHMHKHTHTHTHQNTLKFNTYTYI